MKPTKTVIIDGTKIHDIPSFYEEINNVFMVNEDWKLGQSLDALDDMFYGAYSIIKGEEKIRLIWKNFAQNQNDLGLELTQKFYEDKLNSPSTFNTTLIKEKLAELESGKGQTYFDIIVEIISEHSQIKLIPA